MSWMERLEVSAFPMTVLGAAWRRRDNQLRARADAIRSRAQTLLDHQLEFDAAARQQPERGAELLSALAWLAIERLRARQLQQDLARELAALVCDAQDLAADLREHALVTKEERITACAAALARLRGVRDASVLCERVCAELVRGGVFGRALLSLVEDGTWRPIRAMSEDPVPRSEGRWLGTRIPLADFPVEHQACEEKRALLVEDPSAAPTHAILADAGCRSYVVAPIALHGEVVGLMHATYQDSSRPADTFDRILLSSFAEGLGRIAERAVLAEQLCAQRDGIRSRIAALATTVDELCDEQTDLVGPAAPDGSNRSVASVLVGKHPALASLTPREREVLELVAAGASNAEVAQRLVITDHTAKLHIKRILRKLGAVNRAHAIAISMGVSQP
jgi:DNA-binding CsgD family transcriptional regulator